MGQYKVPQNVEAEDHIIGPLTLKQFIYSLIGIGWAMLCFFIFRAIPAVMIIVAAPVTILFLLLGLYRRDGQNFEQYLVALVGFFSQSRKRLWTKELVVDSFKIEPTKAAAEQSQRDPNEVRSQLDKLASLVDARGWAEQHDAQGVLSADPAAIAPTEDRLIMPAVSAANPAAPAENDVLDLKNSPLAQNLTALIDQAANDVRAEAIQMMRTKAAQAPTAAPKAAATAAVAAPNISVTPPVANDILKLATERDDLTVSQIAAQATRVAPLTEGESVTLRNGAANNPN